jgi:hypothetical protein
MITLLGLLYQPEDILQGKGFAGVTRSQQSLTQLLQLRRRNTAVEIAPEKADAQSASIWGT